MLLCGAFVAFEDVYKPQINVTIFPYIWLGSVFIEIYRQKDSKLCNLNFILVVFSFKINLFMLTRHNW